jgi:alkanesulfonate monooxygenase SsuD/methylene tetrahydromethanopterin reductase-like flavin-dependent oxidoreductase (luciferase family)
MTLAGREAQIVGLAPRIRAQARVEPYSLTFAAAREKIEWVRVAAGERFDSIEINVYPSGWPPVITDDLRGEARKIIDHIRSRTGIELSEQDVIDSPHLFIGSVDRLVEKFLQLRAELGITSIMLGDLDELAPVLERLVDA